MNKKAIILATLVSIVGAGGCGTDFSKPPRLPIIPGNANYNVSDFGNGVIYFPYSGEKFGYALSSYVFSHPKARIISVAADNTGPYGSTVGYFVVVEQGR